MIIPVKTVSEIPAKSGVFGQGEHNLEYYEQVYYSIYHTHPQNIYKVGYLVFLPAETETNNDIA